MGGQLHTGSNKFDISVLKSATSFNIKFNDFSTTEPNNNFNIFKEMHAQCRYKATAAGNFWCCRCTAGKCGTLTERAENGGIGEFGVRPKAAVQRTRSRTISRFLSVVIVLLRVPEQVARTLFRTTCPLSKYSKEGWRRVSRTDRKCSMKSGSHPRRRIHG